MADASNTKREARLAAALRANLARRKALSRSLGGDDKAAAQADIKPASGPAADPAADPASDEI
jgi:hypothetical protein